MNELPILKYKTQIIEKISACDRLLVVSDTGSGKTSQIPQIVHFFDKSAKICVSQPRQVACISNSKRVASELKSRIGDLVGYQVRFDKNFGPQTKIVFMTDGVILKYLNDENFEFDYFILDECHERSVNTDLLLGLLKSKSCKLIAMSATVDTKKFEKYLNCDTFYVPGRPFPVEILHSNIYKPFNELQMSYFNDSIKMVKKINQGKEMGDILVFLTGREEVEQACNIIRNSETGIVAFPLYSDLDTFEQHQVFEKTVKRKVIFSTNIAQTSVTIPNIRFVIDCGFSKDMVYDNTNGISSLIVEPISQSAANQRSGRAGRTNAGRTYRLYSKQNFDQMDFESIPQIHRVNIVDIVLILLQVCKNVQDFDWLDAPNIDNMEAAIFQLRLLDAFEEGSDDLKLSKIGNIFCQFPLSPTLCRALIASVELNCSSDFLKIASMLTTERIYLHNRLLSDEELLIDRRPLFHESGDHLTLLNIYNLFLSNQKSRHWCMNFHLNPKSLINATRIHKQLTNTMSRVGLEITEGGNSNDILKALGTAFFRNVAKKYGNQKLFFNYFKTLYPNCKPKHEKQVEGTEILHLNSQSVLNLQENYELVLFTDIIYTNKPSIIYCSKIDLNDLIGLGKIEKQFGNSQPLSVAKPKKRSTEKNIDIDAAKERYKRRKVNMSLD
eukprot:NODE_488_length_6893_cov_0.585517.p1 type:complete len:668 gc:universal NODE_488_length_6893_cov_0.585517:1600-3603(+)